MASATTDRSHLVYPDADRLNARLTDAKASHLVVFDRTDQYHDTLTYQYDALVTPTLDMEPYKVMVYWTMPDDRVHAHCSCRAGEFATPCKHLALFLDHLGLINKDTRVRVMDAEEYQRFETLAILPDWKDE